MWLEQTGFINAINIAERHYHEQLRNINKSVVVSSTISWPNTKSFTAYNYTDIDNS